MATSDTLNAGEIIELRCHEVREEEKEAEKENGKTSKKENKQKPPPVDIVAAQNASSGIGLLTPSITQTPRTPGFVKYETFRDKEKKIGHRRVDNIGQVTYKKIGTSQIMGSIQLGIQQAVGSLASKPELDVLIQDFYVVETLIFPSDGSQLTPAHQFSEFRFKVYAPIAFRHFRDLFRIAPDDFLLSLCNELLRELSNPGASGSIFYLTNDDEFIIKTVQYKEAEFLQKLLPGYYMNLNQNPRTLLPKFFGLYTYQCNAKNIRLIVMNNILPSSIKLHQKYDLKGSTYKRKANKYERKKASPTFKDLDFIEHHPDGILLEAETYRALIKTIERDCRVLMSFKIMDYSLLVGIHNLDQVARDRITKADKVNGSDAQIQASNDEDSAGGSALNRSRSINRQKLVAHSTAMESIQADADPIDEEEHIPPGGIPARNAKGERLLLFLGIIDILQSYRLMKKFEHTFKSVISDGDTISVHRPTFYAERFQKFMSDNVFRRIPSPLRHSPSRRRGASMRTVPRAISNTEEEATKTGSLEGRPNESKGKNGEETEPCGTPTSTLQVPWKGGPPVTEHNTNMIVPLQTKMSKASPHPVGETPITNAAPNLPAVLQDRPRMRHPPPVPPRSPRGSQRGPSTGRGGGRGTGIRGDAPFYESRPPAVSTPPPTWDSAMTGTLMAAPTCHVKSSESHVTTVAIADDRTDVISVSDVQLEPRSNLTVDGGGSNLHGRSHPWTPPLSVEGSTPTWTEGTPSFTESSCSGDLGCPTTPNRSLMTAVGSFECDGSTVLEMTHL